MNRTLVAVLLTLAIALASWFALRDEPRVASMPFDAGSSRSLSAELEHDDTRITAENSSACARDAVRSDATTPSMVAQTTDGLTSLVVHLIGEATDQPLSGVRVSIEASTSGRECSTYATGSRGTIEVAPITDTDGIAQIEVSPGHALVVHTTTEDHSMIDARVDVASLHAGEQRSLVVRVRAQSDRHLFFGRIVAVDTGAPVIGARVAYEDARQANSDATGRFSLAWWTSNRSLFEISADGFAPRSFVPFEGADSEATERTFELERGATLTVALADVAFDGAFEPVLELTCGAHELVDPAQSRSFRGYGVGAHHEWRATFDEQHRATIENLPASVRLSASTIAGGRIVHIEASPIVLRPGEKREVAWSVDAGCRVTVDARDDAAPTPGVEVWLLDDGRGSRRYVRAIDAARVVRRAITGTDGHAVFDGVLPGTWRIAAAPNEDPDAVADSTTLATAPISFTLEAGETERALELRLHRGLYIEGRMFGPDGRPRAKASVDARGDDDAWISARAGEDGRFKIGPLVEGNYHVRGVGSPSSASSDEVVVHSGAKDVELRLHTGYAVSVQVVDATSGLGSEATLLMSEESSPLAWGRGGQTKSDGSDELEGNEPGVYRVVAETLDGRIATLFGVRVDADHPAEHVVLRVRPGGHLRVRYEGRESYAEVRVFVGNDRFTVDSARPGKPANILVPVGAVRVECSWKDLAEPKRENVTLVAGEEREVVFRD